MPLKAASDRRRADRYRRFLDALGLWGASKPSGGLGLRFPPYSLFDCVQAIAPTHSARHVKSFFFKDEFDQINHFRVVFDYDDF